MAFEDSRLNQTAIIIPPVPFCSRPVPLDFSFKDYLLSALSLIALHFAQNVGECVFISLLPSSKSPFMTRRGEFKFPRAAAAAARCRITTKPRAK